MHQVDSSLVGKVRIGVFLKKVAQRDRKAVTVLDRSEVLGGERETRLEMVDCS